MTDESPQAPNRVGLRVLVLDEDFPCPVNSGKRLRTWGLLSRLARRHEITWLCHGPISATARTTAEAAQIKLFSAGELLSLQGIALYASLLRNCFSPFPYSVDKHFTRELSNELARLLRQFTFDILHCESTLYARYLGEDTEVPSIASAHNVEAQIWERRGQHSQSTLARGFCLWQAWKMKRFEVRALGLATRVTTVSRQDRQALEALGVENVQTVENGVDLQFFRQQSASSGQEILFLATLDWFPNQDALKFFLDSVFPIIRKYRADLKLRVVGRNPPKQLVEMLRGKDGINFIGEVSDVRPEYLKTAVVVVPLRIGGGSRLKILEAMAAGKPVVSTTIGAEGLDVTHGHDIILADTPEGLAREILDLISDQARARGITANGLRLVTDKYSWDSLACKLEDVWYSALGTSPL